MQINIEIQKPRIKGFTNESFVMLYAYAESLESKLVSRAADLPDNEKLVLKMQCEQAWKDAHDMAITVSQNMSSKAKEIFNRLLMLKEFGG